MREISDNELNGICGGGRPIAEIKIEPGPAPEPGQLQDETKVEADTDGGLRTEA